MLKIDIGKTENMTNLKLVVCRRMESVALILNEAEKLIRVINTLEGNALGS